MSYPLIKPTPPTPDKWISYLDESYATNQFCNFGPAVKKLQSRAQDLLQTKSLPLVFCNATLALEIALTAADLIGCDVLVPSFTFAATALAVNRVGGRPVLVDSDKKTWHMSLESATRRLTKKTKAMIVVHPLGMVVDPTPFKEFAKNNNLALIWDSAAALGASYPLGDKVDTTGLCEIFSQHITKSGGSGEGAIIASASSQFLERCRRLSNFGFNESAEAEEFWGTNAKMSDFQAAVALGALDGLSQVLVERRKLAETYIDELSDCHLILPQCQKEQIPQHTFPFFPIQYHGDMQKLKAGLDCAQIGYRQYYKPLHLHPVFKKWQRRRFPVCDMLSQSVICLPCHNALTVDDVKFICKTIREVV